MVSEREGKRPTKLVIGISIACGFYHFVVVGGLLARLGIFLSPLIHRSISLLFAIIILFLIFPMHKKAASKRGIAWYDIILLLLAVVPLGFSIFFQDQITTYTMMGTLDVKGAVFAFSLMLILLECARRASNGLILPGIMLAVVLITTFGQYMPGILQSPGFSPKELGLILYVGDNGFFGIPMQVAATIIIMFLIFSQVLLEIGGSDWFIKLAISLVGGMKGGIAKTSVVAAALFGTISGSPSSCSAAIGSVTIPMMKKSGYSSEFSGGLVATAATGGQILPPVMGAVAFVIANWLEISYVQVALAALVPALLYFVVLFYGVDVECREKNIQGVPRDQIPNFFEVVRSGWYYIIPMLVLIFFLVILAYPPEIAAFYSIVAIYILSIFINQETKRLELPSSLKEMGTRLKEVTLSVGSGVRLWVRVAVICAAIGILVGSLTESGVTLKIASSIVAISGGHLIVVLVLTAVAAYIMGMGMDTLPLYITLAILVAPALVKMGVPPLAAHLYVLFWGLTSFFTPPVCLAVFITSAISESSIWKTGFKAMRLGVVLFIVPFAFIYLPSLMLPAPPANFFISLIRVLIAFIGIVPGLTGFFIKRTNLVSRVLLVAGGCMLLFPYWQVAAIGTFIIVVLGVWQWFTRKRKLGVEVSASTNSVG